jgi:hypothetical protein
MANEPIAPYASSAAAEKQRKLVDAAIVRAQSSVLKNENSMRRVSVRVDDLQTLLDHIETLKADIFDAQKAALEDACDTIEFVASITKNCTWRKCVTLIRAGIEVAEGQKDTPAKHKARKQKAGAPDTSRSK